MKIGIDGSIFVFTGSGVANYSFNLVKNLLLFDKHNEYRIFYSSLRRPKNFYYLKELKKLGAKIYDYPFPPTLLRLCWGKLHIIPVEWLIGQVDVFFSSDFLRPPLLPKTQGITTIHDLTWKIFPKYHEDWIIKAHEKKLEKTIKYNDMIIVDSENTKTDLLRLYPMIKSNNVHVIYMGVGEQYLKKNDNNKSKSIINKYLKQFNNVNVDKYILYVGAIEPRKNLERSIKIYAQLIKEKKYQDFKFLIVGRAGWKKENVFKLVNDLNLIDKIIFVGFVDDDDLPYFYHQAKALIYLSSYEGFGLPPVEAGYCNTPTLLYNNSSLSEIFKSGYPYTKEGEELNTLKQLIDKPINIKKYLKDFSWKQYCQKFLEII